MKEVDKEKKKTNEGKMGRKERRKRENGGK